MKLLAVILSLLLLGGCKGPEAELDRAMALRAKLLASSVSLIAILCIFTTSRSREYYCIYFLCFAKILLKFSLSRLIL